MGGYGSSRWGTHQAATTREEAVRLPARTLREPLTRAIRAARSTSRATAPVLAIGEIGVVVQGVIDARIVDGVGLGATLSALVSTPWGTRTRLEAGLSAREQPLGGLRWQWYCPRCARPCRALYALPAAAWWACRQCHGVKYASQRRDAARRRVFRASRLARIAGASTELLRLEAFPTERPRRMWARRFEALATEHESLIAEADRIRLGALLRALERH
ncbi:hypothetical protein [Gemmatimonas sp.]|uniref:hypothetical protein n=1 Tax=Gemmatimonas sp. TaxID=1962908 RepID=UPI00286E6499|nr:hypothetical protein [Gemmatimonas sp.]